MMYYMNSPALNRKIKQCFSDQICMYWYIVHQKKKTGKLIHINFNFGRRPNLVRISPRKQFFIRSIYKQTKNLSKTKLKKGSLKKFWFMLFRLMEAKLWEKNDYLFYYYFWQSALFHNARDVKIYEWIHAFFVSKR